MYLLSNLWGWIVGSNENDHEGIYPGSHKMSISWVDESNQILYLLGESNEGQFNELWSYTIQTNEWTCLTENIKSNQEGEENITQTDRFPPSREESVSWFDESNQIFYLYGGKVFNPDRTTDRLNDLWSFSMKTKEWEKLYCYEINHDGNYGTKGVSSKDNFPSYRENNALWYDESNQILYQFGGNAADPKNYCYYYYNDLWSFSMLTKEWTWISGSNEKNHKGIDGKKGIPSKDIFPGSRFIPITWFDESNQLLYLFGGRGRNGLYNDIWTFSIKTYEWTWISGSHGVEDYVLDVKKGVSSKEHYPKFRRTKTLHFDKLNQILYFFGGSGTDFKGQSGYFNDLWTFSIKSNEWTWISGTVECPPNSFKGITPENFYPGARVGRTLWIDDEVLYLYGGDGFNNEGIQGELDDIWTYSIKNDKWSYTLISILNQLGVYGTKGVPSKDIRPGVRHDRVTWIDKSNLVLYLYGGKGYDVNRKYGFLNNVWSYSIKTKEWTWISGSNRRIL